MVERLRESFTPQRSTGTPSVQVAAVQPTGNTATFGGDDIVIGDEPLSAIMLSRWTGLKAGEFNIEIGVADIDGFWYVTRFKFSIG